MRVWSWKYKVHWWVLDHGSTLLSVGVWKYSGESGSNMVSIGVTWLVWEYGSMGVPVPVGCSGKLLLEYYWPALYFHVVIWTEDKHASTNIDYQKKTYTLPIFTNEKCFAIFFPLIILKNYNIHKTNILKFLVTVPIHTICLSIDIRGYAVSCVIILYIHM